jgi:GNAT superfamily N-acetyltransferase
MVGTIRGGYLWKAIHQRRSLVADLVEDVSPEAMARANEANLVEWWRSMASHPGGVVVDDPDLFFFSTGVPIAFFNGVVRAHLDPEQADARIESIKGRLADCHVPGTWSLGLASRPTDLKQRLLAHGFTEAGEVPAMGMDLRALDAAQFPAPPEVTIERVRDQEQFQTWGHTLLAGFGLLAYSEPFSALFSPTDLRDDAPSRNYLARLAGEPVATLQMLFAAGVAGLYSIATVPQARGQGIGAAITVAALCDAHALGYRIGVLQASAMGAPIYQRVGFAEHFRYREYHWQPA